MRRRPTDPNKWRYQLDPRDPDYMDPPTADDLDQQAEAEIDAYIDWQNERLQEPASHD